MEDFKEKVLEYIGNKMIYLGRSLAYYEDGRDYGVVTVLKLQTHLIGGAIIVFDDKTGKLLTNRATYGMKSNQKEYSLAPYGKKYAYSFETSNGDAIYIAPIN